MEIQKGGDTTDAKKHLAKADPKAAETLNNFGVIAMLEDDLDNAEFQSSQRSRFIRTG